MTHEEKFNKLLTDNLPEDKVKEFKRLINEGDKEKTDAFIWSILPDIEKIIKNNLEDLF